MQLRTAALAIIAAVMLCCSIANSNAQENIQLQIPPSLVECYNTSYFMNRDNRLPATIDTLITLIEKVENSDGFNLDMRQLAVSILHRFRQDGIQRAPGIVASPGVLPYSPTGFQFPKFRILLSRLIPGDALRFPNNSLSREERCSMHFMLSSSFNLQVRGDENQVCSQLSQYRAQRLPRSVETGQDTRNNFIGDIEILDNFNTKSQNRGVPQIGKQIRQPSNSDFDYWYGNGNGNGGGGTNDNSISQCPVENGVIWTPWGAVTAGTLIAGIAAGLQPQQVQLRTLLALARRQGSMSAPQTATVNVDNRWAATLAGDLAEVALVQVPTSSSESASVGANGAWNSTVMPKWYFLTQRQNLEMTDAEIRGGLDGLILGMNVGTWRTQSYSMKLSQLLRMYYSMDGVLGSGIMACNRKDQFPLIAPLNEMIAQTSAFAQVLDREMQLRVTLSPTAIAQFSTSSANALTSYILQEILNDPSCPNREEQFTDIYEAITPMTHIFVFIDTLWPYRHVVDYLNYILQRLNINPYASTVTMMSASDARTMVNTTHYMTEFYEQWNATTHRWFKNGFSLPRILSKVRDLVEERTTAELKAFSMSGYSLVALIMPSPSATITDDDFEYSMRFIAGLNRTLPDLHFIYYAGGAAIRFKDLVANQREDLFLLSTDMKVKDASEPVLKRIKRIPRRLINPRCSLAWHTLSYGHNRLVQYARPGEINFYRLVPNYFFEETSDRILSVQAINTVTFTVCTSRSNTMPYRNGSSSVPNQNCGQITTNIYSLDLSQACADYDAPLECPPVYLSVQAQSFFSTEQVNCVDLDCQAPDQAAFAVQIKNMDCYGGGIGGGGVVKIWTLNILLSIILGTKFIY